MVCLLLVLGSGARRTILWSIVSVGHGISSGAIDPCSHTRWGAPIHASEIIRALLDGIN